MKRFRQACLFATVFYFLAGCAAVAQPSPSASPVSVVHCMQSTSPEYVLFELDSWLPYHQQRVDEGEMVSWTLYGMLFGERAHCDHVIIETYQGMAQVENAYQGVTPSDSASPLTQENMIADTFAARRMMSSSFWVTLQATEPAEHKYVVINYMQSKDADAYEQLENSTFLPIHNWLREQGHTAGWALFAQLYPHGQFVDHDYVTLDYLNTLTPVPFEQAMQAVHPDMTYAAMTADTEATRTLLKSQVMVRIGGTQ